MCELYEQRKSLIVQIEMVIKLNCSSRGDCDLYVAYEPRLSFPKKGSEGAAEPNTKRLEII